MKRFFTLSFRTICSGIFLLGICSSEAAPIVETIYRFGNTTATPQPGVAVANDGTINLFGTTKSGGNSSKGSIYKITRAGTFSTVVNFNGTNGQGPLSGLILNPNGLLYGTMSDSGYGTLYQMTQTGTLSKLVILTGTDGANPGNHPEGTMVIGPDGNLFGVTSAGGTSDLGTIYRLTTSGSYQVIKSFDGTAGATPLFAPVLANDGFLYGTTSAGGTDNIGTIYKINANGDFTKILDFTLDSGQIPNSGLIQASDGNFYGTSSNAEKTQGAVYRMTPDGTLSTFFVFNTNLELVPAGGVIQGVDGNFYGITPLGGASGYGSVYKITPTGEMSLIYSFRGVTTGASADGGSPSYPLNLASDGNIYGVTNATVFRLRFGPKTVSESATAISYSSATLNGTVNPSGESTTVYFEYADEDPTLANPYLIKGGPRLSGTANATASADIKSLFSSTVYYYRVKAVNATGTQFGPIKSFTTKVFAEPTTAIDIQGDRATLKTNINPKGQPVQVFFRYGIDPFLGGESVPVLITGSETALTSAIKIGDGYNDKIIQKTVSKLLPQTVYYYRAETVDPYFGTQYGNIHSFTTKVMGKFAGFVTNAAPTGIYSGYLSVDLNTSQSMTGALYFGGAKYSLKGAFSSGAFSQTITRGTLPSIVVKLTVDPANHQIKGTVVEAGVTSLVLADQQLYNRDQTPVPQAGKYTLLLPPDPVNSGTVYPQGTGYLTLSVGDNGKVSASGKLGDGSSISCSGVLVSGSVFPIYAGLYGSKSSSYRGSIYGNILFQDPTLCGGTLTWFKAAQPNHQFYPLGFSTSTEAVGSRYTDMGSGSNAWTGSTLPEPAQISFAEGNIAGFTKAITIQPDNKVTVDFPSDNDQLSLQITSKNGLVKGRFFDPASGKKRSFYGVLLQTQKTGGGYFMGSNLAGYFELDPSP